MKKIILKTIALAMSFIFTSCFPSVSPEVMVTDITISPADPVSIYVNEIALLSTIISPSYASEKRVLWESDHPGIATIDATYGIVKGVAAGTATIHATAIDGSNVTATIHVIVASPVVLVSYITITPTTPVSVAVGASTPLGVVIVPSNATIQEVTWSSLDPGIATVNAATGVVTGVATGTATIRATANDASGVWAQKSITVTPGIFEQGVEINGVVWSTRNVDAVGTFAASQESFGMFYQWNRKVAWPTTGPVVWDNTFPPGTFDNLWSPANDPSPAGWRVPTIEEMESLLDGYNVNIQFTTENGVSGRRFIDVATTKSIFLPLTGYRNEDGEVVTGFYYWSSLSNSLNGYALWGGVSPQMYQTSSRMGIPIRPVKITP